MLFEVAKTGVAFYFAHFASYQVVYGSLGGVIALLFWVYVSANILLFGAEVSAEIGHVLRGEPRRGYAPDEVVTNDDLARLGCDANWILERTGIRERRIASDEESTASLAVGAARDALHVAHLAPADVDLVIVCTMTPDHGGMPSVASTVQNELMATRAGAFDLNAACAGFVYGLGVADSLVAAGTHRNVVLIGGTGADKTHLAIAIARALIRGGTRDVGAALGPMALAPPSSMSSTWSTGWRPRPGPANRAAWPTI